MQRHENHTNCEQCPDNHKCFSEVRRDGVKGKRDGVKENISWQSYILFYSFELTNCFILDTIISIIIDIGGTGLKGKGMVKSTLEYNHKTFTDSVVLQAFFCSFPIL